MAIKPALQGPPTPGNLRKKGLPAPVHRHDSGRGVIRVAKRTADALDDPGSIKDWDDEELEKGYRRDKNGGWTGRPPRVVPTECHRELVRRKLKLAEAMLRDNLMSALETCRAIMESPFADDNARLRAADMIINRVMGKAVDKVDVSVSMEEPTWLKALQSATVVEDDDGGMILDVESEELL